MEREWQIGQLLWVALQEPDGTVPGFMKVLDCLARTGKDAKKASFNGMVMERINGWEVWRRIDTPEFCNIHYIRELLFQVFSALDRAQRRLGFHHADLGLRNVMEHYPRLWADVQGEAKSRAASDAAAKANGCTACGVAGEGGGDATPSGSGSLDARGSSAGGQLPPPSPRGSFLESRATARCGLPEPRAGFSCNADGSRMPLGPHIEFKIIDFGVAAFNPTLAQSAGGYEYEEALEKLERVKEALGSGPPGTLKLVSGASLPKFGRGGDAASAIGGPLNLEMVPTEQSNRYRLRLPGASLLARASFTALLKGGKGGSAKAAGAEPPAPAADRRALRATPSVPLGSRKMPMSAIEVMYRKFWKRKGDVYHVLLSLAIVLDDGSPAAGEQGGGGSPAHALEQEREQQEQAPAAWGQLRLEPVCDARLPSRVLALCTGPATAPCPDSTGASSSARASPSAAAGGSDGSAADGSGGSAADGSGGRASRLFASVGRRLVSYGLARYGQLRRMHWTPTGRVITYLRAAPSGMLVASDGRDGVTLYSYSEPSERLPQSRPPLARIWHHREGEPNAPLHLGHHPAREGPAQQQQRHLFGAAPPLPPPPGVQAPPPAFAVVAADAERCAAVGAAALPPRVAAAADGDGDGGEGQAAVVADAGGLVRVVQQRYLQHEAALASIYRFGLGECVAALLPGSLRFGCTGGGGRRGAAAGTSAVVVTTAGGVVELSPLPQHRAQQLLRLQQALVERTEAPAGAGAAQPAAAPAGSHAAFRQTELPQPFQHPPPPQATPCEVMEEESEAEVEEGEATGGTPAAMEAEEGTGHSERGGGGGPHTPPGVLASEAAGEPPSTPEALRRLAAAEAAAAAWAQAEAGAQPVQAILDGDLLRLFLLQPPAQQEQLLAAAAEGPGGSAWEPPADAEQQRADCVWIQQRLSSLLH